MATFGKRAQLIRRLHEKGMTYEEIGDLFGITKQAAQQAASAGDGMHVTTIQGIKYVGLRNWMLKNRVGIRELSRRCGVASLSKTLTGNVSPRKNTIDAVLSVTGLTYEECFREESGDADEVLEAVQ